MVIIWAMILGGFTGWVGSLWMRTDTQRGILFDIAAGALGALPMAALLGNNATFDSLIAGCLGAMIALGIVYLVRQRLVRR